VGSFDDLVTARDGQFRVRLARNWHGTDCAYPGVEILADGTFVLTTYGHWEPGQQPFVRSVRLRLDELDALALQPTPKFERPSAAVTPVARDGNWPKRHAENLAAAQQGGHRILFLGDSITDGWKGAGKEVWQDIWGPRHALNSGIGGDRTQHVLWRLDHGLLEALAGNGNDVRAVVVMIGTNNSNGADHSAEEIAAGVIAVVQRLRHGLPKAGILLLSIFPRGERPNAQRDKCATASRLAAAAFAGDERVRCRDLADRFLGPEGTIANDMMPDRLHLSPAAYRIWAEAIVGDLDAMVK
jgi:beta-glucosidase